MRSNEQFLRELLKRNKMHAMRYWTNFIEVVVMMLLTVDVVRFASINYIKYCPFYPMERKKEERI